MSCLTGQIPCACTSHPADPACRDGDTSFNSVNASEGDEIGLNLIEAAGGKLVIDANTHTPMEIGITSTLPISIRWGDTGCLVFDNIRIAQSPVVLSAYATL